MSTDSSLMIATVNPFPGRKMSGRTRARSTSRFWRRSAPSSTSRTWTMSSWISLSCSVRARAKAASARDSGSLWPGIATVNRVGVSKYQYAPAARTAMTTPRAKASPPDRITRLAIVVFILLHCITGLIPRSRVRLAPSDRTDDAELLQRGGPRRITSTADYGLADVPEARRLEALHGLDGECIAQRNLLQLIETS